MRYWNKDDIEKELGMKESMATARLKKQILFSLVKKTGQDICYVCNEKILTALELSIEHKEKWLHASGELFWDLDNIAFSHFPKYNRPRSLKGRVTSRRIKAPDGTSWCKDHQDFLPLENFHRLESKHNKAFHICKECVGIRGKEKYQKQLIENPKFLSEYYQKNKERILKREKDKRSANSREYNKTRRERYHQNKDEISEKRKEMYSRNKEEILLKQREYRKKRKEIKI